MIQALLLYIADTQREGQLVTRRIKTKLLLWSLAGVFFAIAFIAALIGGSIYLAKELGAGPAALVIAGVSFLLGVIMLITLAIMRRPRVYATRPVLPLAAAPIAAQAMIGGAIGKRPFTSLLTAMAIGFIATRTSLRKKK
ncbi:hypothetical protein HRR99_12930 [Agrobacterium vaccinii]|jgi:hypothetical protein|uniref:hypothetical protein n=1 Tax=Agrobacterium vaccinii TaxID=2735528 RepID=UPI000DD01FD2|nr:hypothetical protein [Agrobacterium vaccinii]UHS62365.1 hypothetical protein HRR99_12930 [Agrobacterium vaccinii]